MELFFALLTACTTLLVGIAFASVFEWTFHRYVMHRPVGKFRYPFEAHAGAHHRIFKADYRYHLQDGKDRDVHMWKIPMAWWNGVALIFLGTIPFVVAGIPFAIFDWWTGSFVVGATGFFVCLGYYIAYEYLHWCMHLPKNRLVERLWVFRKLNGHHLLHHRWMGTNFNVVCPLADFLFGTLLLRSKITFLQAHGSSIPDVQPA